MTDFSVAYFTLTPISRDYNPSSIAFAASQGANIAIYANSLSVSQGAIAGAMAEENTSYLQNKVFQDLLDDYAISAYDPAKFLGKANVPVALAAAGSYGVRLG